ncbi:MAG: sugar phosphate isomerase/epimerase [Halieaceae bacterium]
MTIVYDADESRAIDSLGALCNVAEPLGLKIAIEFVAVTPAWNTLASAAELVTKIGHRNLALDIDILHLARSGGTPADVAALESRLIAHAQLSDVADLTATADYGEEAAANRVTPGDGVFPLDAFLRALPKGTPLELEVPQPPDRPAIERLRHVVTATRQLLDAL